MPFGHCDVLPIRGMLEDCVCEACQAWPTCLVAGLMCKSMLVFTRISEGKTLIPHDVRERTTYVFIVFSCDLCTQESLCQYRILPLLAICFRPAHSAVS